MKITIVQVGKTKEAYFREAEEEYLKRLRLFADVKILTLKEVSINKGNSGAARDEVKNKEAVEILKAISTAGAGGNGAYLVALDEHGKQMDSMAFSGFLLKNRDFGGGNICFVIGGCYGLGEEILNKADYKLSFSSLTFTHEMIRTLLLEQIYRAFTLITGKNYHY